MNKPVLYLAHDPLGNSEAQVTEFDPNLLAEAERNGIIFIAVDIDGDRQIVSAADVAPPDNYEGGITLVQPVYVDDRMQAVVDVFDAMQAVMFPDAAAAAEDAQGRPAKMAARDPADVFNEKLAALREITKAGESR